LSTDSRLLSLYGENAALSERASELLTLATEQGFPLYRALGTLYLGWVKVNTGKVAEGISLLRSGSSAYRAPGAEARTPYHIALLARGLEIAGQIDDASVHLENALQLAERIGERWFTAELYRNKGQLMLQLGDAEAAEELYHQARTLAAEQETRLWELRATLSLARRCRDQGRRSEARDLIAPIFGWFTEGFETPDLKGAKALLAELD
jgi:predicted ATPase